jgi:hypothetical protein
MIELAVARIASPVLGTAFAIDRETALTAWHCIKDPKDGSKPIGQTELTFLDGQATQGRYLQGDSIEDWAILKLEPALSSAIQPIPLRRDVRPWEEARCLGFPVSAAHRDELGFLPILGEVSGEAVRDKARRITIRSLEAGTGLDVRGLSGGPLIPRSGPEEAVGVMSRRLLDAKTKLQVGGVLFACPSHLFADKPLLSPAIVELPLPDWIETALAQPAKAGDIAAAAQVGRRLHEAGEDEAAAGWLRHAALGGSAAA